MTLLKTLHRVLCFRVLVLICQFSASCHGQSQGCCDVMLMDTSQQVAVDMGQALTTGTYLGLSVRFCTTDKVYIQIWTTINSNTVQLKWQTTYTPQSQSQQQSVINLALNSVTIGANDRLGLFSYASVSNWTKMAVPYSLNSVSGAMFVTQSRYTDQSVFITGLQATLSSTQLPRTFGSYVRFCAKSDCSDLQQIPAYTTAPPPFCACPTSCSPDAVISSTIQQQQALTQVLADQLDTTAQQLQALLSSNPVTGICPNGTVSGTYGTGACYAVITQFEAPDEGSMFCATSWPGGKLVDIQSQVEGQFLYSLLSNYTAMTGVSQYWSSGIYSFAQQQYVWGQSNPYLANILMVETGYLAFAQNNAAAPPNSSVACIILTVDSSSKSVVWNDNNCYEKHHFVCKTPKLQCF